MRSKVLILGASGSFGSHCAEAFTEAGWDLREFRRGQEDMAKAATGMDVIVNGLNPPNYKGWATVLPQIAHAVSAAAKAIGATIIQPGNVYNYGSQPGMWDEHTPHLATTKKGRARIEMEGILRAASARDGVRVIILRGGDFMGRVAGGNFIDYLLSKQGSGKLIYPGRTDVPHAWAYLPDMARAAVALAEIRTTLGGFEDVPFQGHTLTGEELRTTLAQLTGRQIRHARFPWPMMKLLSPFWPLAREMQEMRYLWDMPHSLSGARLKQLLPDFSATPTPDILRNLAG